MSEKEKAQELVEKFKDFVHGYIGSSMLTNTEYPEQILSQAKKVATMVVDEILFEIRQGQKLDWIEMLNERQEYIVYWAKVKAEIQDVVLAWTLTIRYVRFTIVNQHKQLLHSNIQQYYMKSHSI